jgi:nuclear cap-binding protein subunit 1
LGNAINKTTNRTKDLLKDVNSIQKAVTAATAAVAKAQGKLDLALQMADVAETDEYKLQAKAKNDWATSSMRRAKEEESSSQESLEAKQALLARALREQEASYFFALFIMQLDPTYIQNTKNPGVWK